MKYEDFYELKPRQVIYYKGVQTVIKLLNMGSSSIANRISFYTIHEGDIFKWKEICQDCSIEPPKEKKRKGKIKLIRVTVKNNSNGSISQTAWESEHNFSSGYYMVLKTEEKEIEIGEKL